MDKPRIFVDMDGTLAEWRHINLIIEKDEDRKDIVDKLHTILLAPGYYESLLPQERVVQAINNLLAMDKVEVYVASCYLEPTTPRENTSTPKEEKIGWLHRFLPDLPDDHMIFVPDGEDKSLYVPEGIKSTDVLLDDFTKNLIEWEKAGGKAVKLMNEVNDTKGTWKGAKVSKDSHPINIMKDLLLFATNRINDIQHPEPFKNKEALFEIDKDFTISDDMLEDHKTVRKYNLENHEEDDLER